MEDKYRKVFILFMVFIAVFLIQFVYIPGRKKLISTRKLIMKKYDEYDQLLSLCKEYKDLSSKKNQFLQGYQKENFSLISFISEIADKYSLKPNMKEIKIYPEIKREDFVLQKVKVLFTEIELKKIYEILKNIEESKNKIYISYYNQKRNREKPFLLDVEMELYVLKKKK
ncbi:MAG: hypothetical protein DRP67_03130 [Candidatus Omnitrophota bacterium]|nr:MAG: hypothetical protein DRP67_03130 [Candidatus Omnitrophota bacterium]